MRRLIWCIAAVWMGTGATPSAGVARERLPLDDAWRFQISAPASASDAAFDDQTWRLVDLPHDWGIESTPVPDAPGGGAVGFFPTGIGWYRRELTAPEKWRGKRIILEFEGAGMNAEVWVNGATLGVHPYGYTPFAHDITKHLVLGARNTLAVRIDNSQQPNSRWYSGSGIYRHVWLHVVDPVHVPSGGVFVSTAELSTARALVRVQTTVRNASGAAQRVTVETTLIDPNGKTTGSTRAEVTVQAGAEARTEGLFEIPAPHLWSPDTPQLYWCTTRLRVDRRLVDKLDTTFGIRTLRVSAERGFELNGRSLELNGGNVHHDHGVLGAASFDAAEEWRVRKLKEAGFNAIRTSHNPPSTAFLEACDRLGMLVVDEAFDGWAKKKNPHDYGVHFKDWWQRDIDAMVLRDRNHPSVVMWSIGNEVYERGNEDGRRIARELAARIRELDPTRPVTAGINGMGKSGRWEDLDPLFAALDVAGYNYEMNRHAADHERLPARVIVGAESYQSDVFSYWEAARDHTYVIGDFVWSGWDYLGEAGIGRVFPPGEAALKHWEGNQWPWHGAYCGDIDITGWRKPVSHYRNIVWDRGEKLYAAVLEPAPGGGAWNLTPWSMLPALPSWTWPGHEGQPLSIEVYSRHEAVRLSVNGTVAGEKGTTRAEQFRAVFDVPYAPGRLEVVGLDGGRVTETFALQTAGAPVALRLTSDRWRFVADGQDLCFVLVEAIDASGVVNPAAAMPVTIALSGPATVAGVGTGDMASLASYRANPHRLFQGRALVVIRAGQQSGKINLAVSAEGLKTAADSITALPRRRDVQTPARKSLP
jgi:beta-galactosidase